MTISENYMIFDLSQLDDFFTRVEDKSTQWQLISKGKSEVYNIPAAFDTETTSIYRKFNGEQQKAAWVYVWMFGIDDMIILGRDLLDFQRVISRLATVLNLSKSRLLYVYVHNLGYDFQFIRKFFDWEKVFSVDNRRPIYARTGGVEFKDSLILANSSLEVVGNNLQRHNVEKKVGDLDYSLIRHTKTPLTEKEIGYCINDIKVLLAYISEKIEDDGDITKIPLTNTGYVRRYVKEKCYDSGPNVKHKYRRLMNQLRVTSTEEYKMLQRAFQGGFTHASYRYSNIIVENVGSGDIASSYPTAMCAEARYPMSNAHWEDVSQLTLDKFHWFLKNKACLMTITFYDICMSNEYETPISLSRCKVQGTYQTNNGRVVKAEVLTTTITELDYDTIVYFYEWKGMTIDQFLWYDRGYLPKQIIEATLDLYEKKTTLKGVDDKVIEYMISKNMINSIYGMMVTNIVRPEHVYDDEEGWLVDYPDVDKELDSYNKGFHRFLYYAWGVWVTAIARHNLFSAIKEFGPDYVYCDTDSIKGINFDKHREYFRKYNSKISQKLLKMCYHYAIPFEKTRPKTKYGIKKPLGVWEEEDGYAYFKTCGAKRYMYIEKSTGNLNLTVSGLRKKDAVKWLLENYDDPGDIFQAFGDGFKVPAGHTGKMTLTYIDEPRVGCVKDHLGNYGYYNAPTSIHMEPQSFEMAILPEYIKFLLGIREVQI